MSAESTELERAELQKKDRAQLMSIASALGGKPGSKARKAELVDMILDLTGVTEGIAPADRPGTSTPAGVESPAGAGSEATEDRSERAAGRTADKSRNGDRPARGDSAVRGGGTSRRGFDQGERSRPDQDRGDSERSTRNEDRQRGQDRSERTERVGGDRQRTGPDRSRSTQDDRSRAGGERQSRDRPEGDQGRARSEGDQGRGRPDPEQGRDRSDADRGRDGGRSGVEQASPNGENRDDIEPANRRRRRHGRGGELSVDPTTADPIEVEGLLDLRDDGYGFLRLSGFLPSKEDVYVSVKQVRQNGLRRGDLVKGTSRPAARNEKNPALAEVLAVNGREPSEAVDRPRFDDLTPLYPDEPFRLESAGGPDMTGRVIDLVSPIGKGQRGMIVSPPKAGKTTIMKQIAQAIERSEPDVKLIVLLIDERPEEVTDMARSVRGEVVASTFDRPAEEHTMIAELTVERAKRMVEMGDDVVLIVDGITRLARAYNMAAPGTGRIMSGGMDTGAIYPPKRFFGAARNLEEGGSLTILATALVETGSRMDEVIFEEFKGTGNMELRLDRRLAERRIYPAIDIDASSTRHEELLVERQKLNQIWKLRRVMAGIGDGGDGGLELLIDRLRTFRTNDEFLADMAKAPSA